MSEKYRNNAGNDYWRSLDQLADSPEYRRFLEQEFPKPEDGSDGSITRRKFLGLVGASLAMAGLAGCRKPVEKIVPYVTQPEEVIPGVPNYYATTMPFGTSAYGLIIECHEGRPTKIEGNPLHSSTLGRANALIQAEMLNLYDPDRSRKVLKQGAESKWEDFVTFWRDQLAGFKGNNGEGLAFLTEEFSSPSMFRLGQKFRKQFRAAQFAIHQPVRDSYLPIRGFDGNDAAFRPDYHYDKARVILSLDADFLMTESENVIAAARFADGRRITDTKSESSRLYMVEPEMTATGAMADHRLRLPRSMVGAFTGALAFELESQGIKTPLADVVASFGDQNFDKPFLSALVKDLIRYRGESIIVTGRCQPELAVLVEALNRALGNIGKTVTYNKVELTASSLGDPGEDHIGRIVEAAQAGKIKTLVILGGNPVYECPAAYDLAGALKNIEQVIQLSAYVNETTAAAGWHIPQAHFLESWGDTRAVDGALSITQPMILPLFDAKGDVEFLNLIATGEDKRGYDIVRETWNDILKGGDFEKSWRQILHDGVYAGQSRPVQKPEPKFDRDNRKFITRALMAPFKELSSDNMELTFQVSPGLYDGRFANNGWLQELPHPVNKLTWDNAACISPKTAEKLSFKNGDMVKMATEQGTAELPVWIVPGQADYTVSVTFGYGRTASGRYGKDVGVNVYPLRPREDAYFASGVKLTRTGKTYRLATTQDHGAMAGRPIVREADIDEFRKNPGFAEEAVEHPPLVGIYPEYDYSHGYQWGMAVDLNACVGCNACTIACQSENNIPTVGKERVLNGREMHWIRIDRYFTGDTDDPQMVFMPVPCQQCQNAPCEEVCPVAATVHDSEGLNVMTYNRCIGTRYCSNNCPYKVRHFNFFNYTKDTPEIVRMAKNPDVTMRSRGVMEKCTFCIQRISRAKIKAKNEGRQLKEGEIMTACQQTCPANAIVFGNINDPESRVSKIKKLDRNYVLLAEFNTKTRNTYMARIRNPHPDLKDNSPKEG